MFHLNNHTQVPLFVFYGEQHNDQLIATLSCCELGIHSFDADAFMGINVCSCCGQVDAVFELFASEREDGAGAIYTLISIENVREFAGCKTAEECARVADLMVSGNKLAA
jgi:hypothetical protein